jgi:hypothetical protein
VDKDKLNKIRENIKLFLKSAFDMEDRSSALIKKEAMDELDNFMLLCYADLLPIEETKKAVKVLEI